MRKKTADKRWDVAFREALHKNIDTQELAWAMEQCNIADQALIDFENFTRVIKKGAQGLSDEEFTKKYVDPYRESKAP